MIIEVLHRHFRELMRHKHCCVNLVARHSRVFAHFEVLREPVSNSILAILEMLFIIVRGFDRMIDRRGEKFVVETMTLAKFLSAHHGWMK